MADHELFELAVKRAAVYAQRLGLPRHDPEALRQGLELWYLRTRFAYRVPFERVLQALSRPDAGYESKRRD